MAFADPTPRRVVSLGLAAAGAAVALLVPAAAPARAASFNTAGPEFARAGGVAQAHGGSLPCGGQIAFGWRSEDPDVNATTYWTSGPFGPTACEVVFNRDAGMGWVKFCTVLTHELGHLHGQDHRGDDLMSAIYRRPLGACIAADPSPPPPPDAAAAPVPAAAAPTSRGAKPKFDGVFLDAPRKRRAKPCARGVGRRARASRARCLARRKSARSRRRSKERKVAQRPGKTRV